MILPPKPKQPALSEPEDVSVVDNAKVRVTPHGKIQFFSEEGSPVVPKKKTKQVGSQKKLRRQQYLAGKKAAKSMGSVKSKKEKTPLKQVKTDSLPATSTPLAEVVEMDLPSVDKLGDSESVTPNKSSKKSKKLSKTPEVGKTVKSPRQSSQMTKTPTSDKKSKSPAETKVTKSVKLGKRKSVV